MPRTKPKSISSRQAIIPVQAIDFVMYDAKNVAEVRAFYQKLFGFRRGHEWNDFWSEFATEPITLCLNGPPKAGRLNRDWQGTPCVAMAVDNVPDAIAKCRKHGVKILIPAVETRVCWMAWIADPAGNRICLHSRKDGTAG
jgi:predicted enzyme related to lactoylglutathione lyase